MIDDNNNGFITVEIQYRLGAFGQLASADVQQHGKLNVGLLDQRFALEWVQKYISTFGGDPARVTVGGESSGAASVMYQSLAYGGRDSGLFNNVRNLRLVCLFISLTVFRSSWQAHTSHPFTNSMIPFPPATTTTLLQPLDVGRLHLRGSSIQAYSIVLLPLTPMSCKMPAVWYQLLTVTLEASHGCQSLTTI